jgi:hypothetical protein
LFLIIDATGSSANLAIPSVKVPPVLGMPAGDGAPNAKSGVVPGRRKPLKDGVVAEGDMLGDRLLERLVIPPPPPTPVLTTGAIEGEVSA